MKSSSRIVSKETLKKLRKIIKEELQQISEYDIAKAHDPSYNYERIKLDVNILEQVIFKEEDDSKRLIFSASELRKLDLSEIDFAGVDLVYADLSYTNANINPQVVYKKNLWGTSLAGLDLKGKDFTGVSIAEADLSNTGADIDPQKVYDKSLYGTNLTGLDLKDKNFEGVSTYEADLTDTGAKVYFNKEEEEEIIDEIKIRLKIRSIQAK